MTKLKLYILAAGILLTGILVAINYNRFRGLKAKLLALQLELLKERVAQKQADVNQKKVQAYEAEEKLRDLLKRRKK